MTSFYILSLGFRFGPVKGDFGGIGLFLSLLGLFGVVFVIVCFVLHVGLFVMNLIYLGGYLFRPVGEESWPNRASVRFMTVLSNNNLVFSKFSELL